jgi:hypothetical protein
MKILTLVMLLLIPRPLTGQSVGANVGGVVSDESGALLQKATITITHVLNGRKEVITTGHAGEYRAVRLIPGDYDLSVAQAGFASVTRRVTLLVGAEATVNFTLTVSGVAAHTTVRAEIPFVEVARSQPSAAVTKPQIEALPVLERNFLVLAQLLPGSGPINSTVGRLAFTKFGGVADQRSGYTTLIDGGDIDDAQWGSPTINVSQDAVQEFKVFRNQFDAQHGHGLNAVVTVVTRSGTNQFRGSGFYFGRDQRLNARNPLAAEKPPFDEQRLGGSLGGPLARDRSHFFAAYERDNVDTARIIALPALNPFATGENGVFPAQTDNHMATVRLDHRMNVAHGLSLRYLYDNQKFLRAGMQVRSDSNQVDIFNRSHSLVFEETWGPSRHLFNAFRVHLLNHSLGTVPRTIAVGIIRPSVTLGQTNAESQVVPRTKVSVSDAMYLHTQRHNFKFGGEFAFASQALQSHIFEHGVFEFQTDAEFDPNDQRTWPISFRQQKPSVFTYNSRELGFFLQDDWRLAERIRLNAGLRYDLDLNLRIDDFYGRLLDDPGLAGLEQFVSKNRGTDTNNLQPRLGATWDTRGNGTLVVRGGWGLYVTRNRPWFQLRSMNQFGSSVVRVDDPARLRHFPNIDAVLGGRSLDDFIASGGPRQLGTVIPDNFVQPYASNTTIGVGWQLNRLTALDIDYVHSYADHQTGLTDRNLPASGPITTANPRPVRQFGQVLMIENYTKSWYDALETQFRTQFGTSDTFQVSYALSRSYLDGVDHFNYPRGTQRTPHERGYNPTDQRHNLTIAGTITLSWDIQVSGIVKLISGSPMKIQAGIDLDGDQSLMGDLPAAVPITVGRERVAESLAAINELRTSRRLPPVDETLLALDPYRTLDMRIAKALRVGADKRIEIMIEGFNVTNHVNFRPPSPFGSASANIVSPAFLLRTAARDARQIQWGLRYAF